jgi:type IV pilus assembly protein PilV
MKQTIKHCLHGSKKAARRHAMHGVTMLEVLVIILVLSFGLLGVAGLQARTASYKVNSWARAAASIQVSSFADALRANPGQAGQTYSAAAPIASTYEVTDDWATQQADALTIAVDCLSATCTAAQRAAFDLTTWRTQVRTLFPQGAVTITGDRANGVNVSIAWFDKQLVDTAGALGRSEVCGAAVTDPIRQANCCPTSLVGNPALEGVRCTNVSFVP